MSSYPLKHKYSAKPSEYDGKKFASKKEARYYLSLKKRMQEGEILFFLRQVPFDLPGNVKYRLDFLEFHSDGTVHAIDVKGFRTDIYILKKKQLESIYPIIIEEV